MRDITNSLFERFEWLLAKNANGMLRLKEVEEIWFLADLLKRQPFR